MSNKKKLWQPVWKWMKKVCFLIFIIILVALLYLLISMLPSVFEEKCKIPDYVLAVSTTLTLIVAYFEYCGHKQRERAATFSEYNKRYSEDENIKAVTKYLICFLEHHEKYEEDTTTGNNDRNKDLTQDAKKPAINKNYAEVPSVYQKEMFLRFFEEIEFQMRQGRLTKNEVTDFFAYYAVAAAMDEEFLKDTDLGKKNYKVWQNYRNFVKRFEDMEESIANDYARSFADKNGIERLQLQIF